MIFLKQHKKWQQLVISSLFFGLVGACTQMPKTTDINTPVVPYPLDQPQIRLFDPDAPVSAEQKLRQQYMFDWLVGEFVGHAGNLEQASNKLTSVATQIDSLPAIARATQVALYAKQLEKAYMLTQRWLELDPDNMQTHRIMVSLSLQNNNIDKAAEHLKWVLTHSEENRHDTLVNIVVLLSRQTNIEQSLTLMANIVSTYPNDADAYMAYGNLAMVFKRDKIAAKALREALTINPMHATSVMLQAQLQARNGQTKQAIEQLATAVKAHPSHTGLRTTYARQLLNAKQYRQARYHFEYLLEDSPNDGDLLLTLGLLSLDEKQLEKARGYFERLQILGTRNNDARYYLGRIAKSQQRYKDALHYFLSIQSGNHVADGRLNAAIAYSQLQQLDNAQQILVDLRAKADPALSLQSYLTEAQILSDNGHYQNAYDLLTEALSTSPENNYLLYTRSVVATKLKRTDWVEQDLRDILTREPDNYEILNVLGYILTNNTTRYDQALELIGRAMQLDPGNAAITDSYGWVLYKMGRTEEAIKHLREALYLQFDPEIAAHFGEALWVSGDQQSAISIWNKALEHDPNHKVLLDTIHRFNP